MFFNAFQTSSHSVDIKRNGLAVLHQCFMPFFFYVSITDIYSASKKSYRTLTLDILEII